jgi:hypothetical protein
MRALLRTFGIARFTKRRHNSGPQRSGAPRLAGYPIGAEAENTSPRHLTPRREHRGKTSGAPLHCDDEEVIPRLLEILKGCIGQPMSRIGDLDVDL